MNKIRCTRCGSIGYTASPNSIKRCGCGGRHEIIDMTGEDCRINMDDITPYLREVAGDNGYLRFLGVKTSRLKGAKLWR